MAHFISSLTAANIEVALLSSYNNIVANSWNGNVVAEAYLPDASETAEGVVELATNAEVIAGTDTTRAVTSAGVTALLANGIPESAVTAHEAALTITESQISDLQAYLLTETNDLTAAVTWANVPDANITSTSVVQHEADIDHDALLNFVADEHIDWTLDAGASNIHVNNIVSVPESAVTAHEAALTIAYSQITGHPSLGAADLDDLTDVTVTSPADFSLLRYDTGTVQWIDETAEELGLSKAPNLDRARRITGTTINGSGQYTQIIYNNGVTYDFTYNPDGTIDTKSDGITTWQAAYTSGDFTNWTVI